MSGYASGVRWVIPPAELAAGVKKYGDRLLEMLRVVVGYHKLLMEQWAKLEAPWTDRTGHARQSLHATGEVIAGGGSDGGHLGVLTIAHGVEYGIWLELAHAGRWGIIQRTLDEFEGRVMQAIREALA